MLASEKLEMRILVILCLGGLAQLGQSICDSQDSTVSAAVIRCGGDDNCEDTGCLANISVHENGVGILLKAYRLIGDGYVSINTAERIAASGAFPKCILITFATQRQHCLLAFPTTKSCDFVTLETSSVVVSTHGLETAELSYEMLTADDCTESCASTDDGDPNRTSTYLVGAFAVALAIISLIGTCAATKRNKRISEGDIPTVSFNVSANEQVTYEAVGQNAAGESQSTPALPPTTHKPTISSRDVDGYAAMKPSPTLKKRSTKSTKVLETKLPEAPVATIPEDTNLYDIIANPRPKSVVSKDGAYDSLRKPAPKDTDTRSEPLYQMLEGAKEDEDSEFPSKEPKPTAPKTPHYDSTRKQTTKAKKNRPLPPLELPPKKGKGSKMERPPLTPHVTMEEIDVPLKSPMTPNVLYDSKQALGAPLTPNILCESKEATPMTPNILYGSKEGQATPMTPNILYGATEKFSLLQPTPASQDTDGIENSYDTPKQSSRLDDKDNKFEERRRTIAQYEECLPAAVELTENTEISPGTEIN